MTRLGLLVGLALFGPLLPAFAEMTSIRPVPRPGLAVPPAIAQDNAAMPSPEGQGGDPAFRVRPVPRPDAVRTASGPAAKGLLGRIFGAGKPAKTPKAPSRSASGSVCNDTGIRGTAIPAIRGAQKGCGVENPVRITEVDGVTLSMPATMDCDTARALRQWVTEKVQPAFGRDPVVGLRVAAHYACRGRNNKAGARISEHGKGKAVDIAGFTLASGTELTVLDHYKSRKGKPIRAAHKGACGIFGTTLGPGSDGYHADHLHLDTARYRGGPYCK